jgi:hypothetical protein
VLTQPRLPVDVLNYSLLMTCWYEPLAISWQQCGLPSSDRDRYIRPTQ